MKNRVNTFQKGSVRYIVFKENDSFHAVGLELNIVVDGSTKETALFTLFDAIKGYIESAKKASLRPIVLNQKADDEYEELWRKLNKNEPIKSPYEVATFGRQLV